MPYELRTLDSDVLDWISSRCLNVGLFFWRFTCSESSGRYSVFMFGSVNPTCSIRKNAESVERLK
ncbi:hypothetical protein fEgAba01_42 [Acinetobacter phage fEg-Aba01]|nr:hypothetical protein fEgAba01_42 [Acinetobacter phage fEg-Aba01]QJT69952.1 hypothetical protein fLiAba02_44 [Acinetobacter phage fLi-Aba02]QJT70006.1 hypothetical protein fLiAba03_44 [Acinetobacter phage fLi-Aba03]